MEAYWGRVLPAYIFATECRDRRPALSLSQCRQDLFLCMSSSSCHRWTLLVNPEDHAARHVLKLSLAYFLSLGHDRLGEESRPRQTLWRDPSMAFSWVCWWAGQTNAITTSISGGRPSNSIEHNDPTSLETIPPFNALEGQITRFDTCSLLQRFPHSRRNFCILDSSIVSVSSLAFSSISLVSGYKMVTVESRKPGC